MDKALRDLIEIIHFMENVAAKIHGVLDEAEIYRIIGEEFGKSGRYSASILLLTNDASKLRIAETSVAPDSLNRLEKACKLRLTGYTIDLNRSTTYRQVVRDGKTVQADASDLLREILPRPLVCVILRTLGYERRPMVLTPLYRHAEKMGALAVSSPELVGYFIPSVRNFARHISTASELAHEHAERTRAEQLLRESESKYRDLVEQSLMGVLIAQGSPPRIVFANQGASEILGYTANELVSLSPKEAIGVVSPSDQKIILQLYRSGLGRNQPPLHATFRLRRKDKREIWVETYSKNIEYDGRPAVQAVLVDTTERRMAEEALRESEEKFRNLAEQSPNMIFINENGRVVYANQKCEEITGYKREELYSPDFDFLSLIAPHSRNQIKSNFNRHMKGEEVLPLEYSLVTREGKMIAAILTTKLISYEGERAILGTVTDITERKRMERKLQEYTKNLEGLVEERNRELREAERMAAIGETAAMVGHDLRNPLQSMVNTLYLIKDRVKSMPTEDSNVVEKHGLSKFWGTLADQVEYMNKVISDLQDFARSVKPKPASTRTLALINDALSIVRIPQNLKVSTKIPEKLRKLKADPVLMRRVLVNLITNAVQAMPEGGELTITASETDDFASISVCDTGVGIAAEDLPKLFQPLFTTKAKGQGFGLPVCKRLVEAHGGSITVESQMGRGSTFTVKIPLEKQVR